jgi:periplasmic protein TonB
MSGLGNLSQCILHGDPVEVGGARRLRSRALAASTLLETGLIACLLIWPLIKTGVLPLEHALTPVPVFHRAVQTNPPPVRRQSDHRAVRQFSILAAPTLSQPPRIPPHTDTNVDREPPALSDLPVPGERDQLGTEIGGDGTQVRNIARPGARSGSGGPVVVSRGVMAALLIDRVQPEYPRVAQAMHLAGTVELRAIIGIDGSVRNLEVVAGNSILAGAAVDAVRQWRYQPTRLNGVPVEVETIITVQFHME